MAEFPVPATLSCHACAADVVPRASLGASLVEQPCPQCGEINYLVLDEIHFRMGLRLLLYAEELSAQKHHDMAVVAAVSAIDAALGRGIVDLTDWRAVQSLQPPPPRERTHDRVRGLNTGMKFKKYERLAGRTLEAEIELAPRTVAVPTGVAAVSGEVAAITDVAGGRLAWRLEAHPRGHAFPLPGLEDLSAT